MDYCILASGASMFDACHAYGLGVLLAHTTSSPVKMVWEGVGYRLSTNKRTHPTITPDTIQEVLVLPDATALADTSATQNLSSVAMGNLDGLLAVTFTTRGVRAVSVQDGRSKEKFNDAISEQAVDKAQALVDKLIAYLERLERKESDGLSPLLRVYAPDQAVPPILKTKGANDLTIPMTMDPMLSFSTRPPFTNGCITENTNLATENMPLATLLAFVGAARFLRGQRCASRLVNLYLPLPQQMTITATPCLPLLAGTALPAQQALAARWLSPTAPSAGVVWRALACHTLQTQGSSQSITRAVGVVDYVWLATLQQRVGDEVGAYWRFALHQSREALTYELDILTACLLHRSGVAWLQHLNELAHIVAQQRDGQLRTYTDHEVKEITQMLPATENLPLRMVLAHEQGTKRFGHALRQLGKYNPSALRELAEDLDAVRDLDQLLRLLAQMTQTCVVLKAKSEFILVPTDDDLDLLLADVEQFGARRIASVLLILAVLRYPREEREEQADSPEQGETNAEESEEMTPSAVTIALRSLLFGEEQAQP